MKGISLLGKVSLAVVGTALGLVMLLLGAVACVLYVPSLQSLVAEKGIAVAHEQAGWDIDVGQIDLSVATLPDSTEQPVSPLTLRLSLRNLFRAYKGQTDLPVALNIDSVFIGHRGQDTLAYVHALRLRATALTANDRQPIAGVQQLLATPIAVEQLRLDDVTFHSDSLIPTVGVDVLVDHLAVTSPGLNIAQGRYPLHNLRLSDTFVGIDLRSAPPDSTAEPPAPVPLAFEVPDGELRNIHFALTPVGLDIRTRLIQTDASINVGENSYQARRIDIGRTELAVADFSMPIDTVYGDAYVELSRQLITSNGLHVRVDEMGARADLKATEMNLETMRVAVDGEADFQGSRALLNGYYGINDQSYSLHADVERVNLAPFMPDSTRVVIAGQIDAQGRGFDPNSRAMRSRVKMHLTDAVYDNICVSGLQLDAALADRAVEGTLHLPFAMTADSLRVSAQTEHQFHVADFMTPDKMQVDYRTQMRDVKALVSGEHFYAQQMDIRFTTDSATALNLATEGLTADVTTPMHVMEFTRQISALSSQISNFKFQISNINALDTLRELVPDLTAHVVLSHGSPAQQWIESKGLDINTIDLSLASDSLRTILALDASIPEIGTPVTDTPSVTPPPYRLPAANAALRLSMQENRALASLTAGSKLTDGAMMLHDLKTDADLRFDLERSGTDLRGKGRLTLDSLSLSGMELGSRAVDMSLEPSDSYPDALRADVQLDDIPLEIVEGILQMEDLGLTGAVRAQATIDGLPERFDLSAEVLPLAVAAKYKPYNVQIGLGETPVVMNHNKVDFNGLPIYGADSTYLTLTGGLDLNSMRLDIALAADSFAPVKLVKDGPIPVYGDLATDIRGTVTGPLDSIVADVDVTILPTTDITYPIDKKNLAQVKPYGTVNVRYEMAEDTLLLGGQVNVDDGFIRYSPKAYPIMPFHVDSGSHVAFNGPIGQTRLGVSASQKVKADVQSRDEETRRVDFTTGVRVNGVVDSIGIHSIGFFLEAPEDETITHELESLDEDTREGLAATLLATGMYVGESNVAAQREGYALSSIINSRINAAMANSKVGKFVDIDLSTAQTEHAAGKTNDMNISISKSFFKDRFRITVGSTLTDNPEVNQTSGLLSNLSAEYKLTKDGDVLLRAFADRDYNNVLEGELYKTGLGVRATKDWKQPIVLNHKSEIINHKSEISNDTIYRVYTLTADAGVVYRSNNSIGPDVTLKSSMKNLLGYGETFTIKGNGAYYWALRDRHPGDPKKTDTYKFGVNTSLVFPYLHWGKMSNVKSQMSNVPEGDTRYMLGYQYENIAGGYGVHKLTGSFTYFIRSSRYITHAFTPLSLSVVLMKTESDSLWDKAAAYPQLIKVIAGNEFVPSIGYTFTYNDYRSKRAVNTLFEVGVKESGNLINALYCLAGHNWNEKDKKLGAITFHQFVKMNIELRNKFNFTDQVCIATRLFAGANVPLGNSYSAPLSEAFYAGGPNGMRAVAPYAYGPGNFYSEKYNQNFFHAGDVKLEANFELRFPIVWKLYGATFLDAGNVWNWYSGLDVFKAAGITDYKEQLQLREDLRDGLVDNPDLLRQIALGTGAGLRLDLDGLVIRLDLGVAIHAPYQTYRYDKDGKPDKSQPINTYFNLPSALDVLRLNFGIGYPF